MTIYGMLEEHSRQGSFTFRSMTAVAVCILSVLACFVIAADSSDAEVPTSGTTGDCSWSISGTTLTISGNGSMGDCEMQAAPWYGSSDSITEVIIGNGVTNIGNNAFVQCSRITTVSIGTSVETIGANAFYKIGEADIVLPDNVKYIEEGAFFSSINSIAFGNGIVRVHENAFFGLFDSDGNELAITPENVNGHLFTAVGEKLCRDLTSVNTDVPDMNVDVSKGSKLDATSISNIVTEATNDSTATLTVTCGDASMVFDNTATRNLVASASEITLKEVGVGSYKVPADSKVFQISFGNTHQLNGGKITVTVPYDGATAGKKLFYIDNEEKVYEAGDVSFSAGKATFVLEHLSTYAIADSSAGDNGGSNDNTMLYIGIGAVVAILVIVGLLFILKPSFLRRD